MSGVLRVANDTPSSTGGTVHERASQRPAPGGSYKPVAQATACNRLLQQALAGQSELLCIGCPCAEFQSHLLLL